MSKSSILLSSINLNCYHLQQRQQSALLENSLPTSFDSSEVCLPDFLSRTESLLIYMHITLSMVSDIISKLDFHKASGFNDGPAIVLKICAPVPSKLNKFLTNSCFPAYWKSSSVVPVFENSEEAYYSLNYCPISLLTLFGNALEALIKTKLEASYFTQPPFK